MTTKRRLERDTGTQKTFSLNRANTILAGAALCVSIWSSYWQVHQTNLQKSSVDSQKKSADKQFGEIQTSIRLLTATVAPQLQKAIDDSLQSSLTATPQKAAQTFAAVQSRTSSLRQLKVHQPEQELAQTSLILKNAVDAHPDVPAAWAASAEWISYRSGQTIPQLPNCFSSKDLQNKEESTMIDLVFHDCTLDLGDNAGFLEIVPKLYQRRESDQHVIRTIIPPNLVLRNGVVHYAGGQIIPFGELHFENCHFDFTPGERVPPLPGRILSQQLLIADLKDVNVSIPRA